MGNRNDMIDEIEIANLEKLSRVFDEMANSGRDLHEEDYKRLKLKAFDYAELARKIRDGYEIEH